MRSVRHVSWPTPQRWHICPGKQSSVPALFWSPEPTRPQVNLTFPAPAAATPLGARRTDPLAGTQLVFARRVVPFQADAPLAVSYTHPPAPETRHALVCRL